MKPVPTLDSALLVPEAAPITEEYRLHRRFDRLARLYGDDSVSRLMGSRVAVFGLGGVGSFAAEALTRSAVGELTVVDFDDVCVTNANRQLQALSHNVGKNKAAVLGERMEAINPRATVIVEPRFYNAARSDEFLGAAEDSPKFDYVVDCIDNITAKCHLIASCVQRGIPVITSMGAAAKVDPTRVAVDDLAQTRVCPLAKEVRRILRTKYGMPRQGKIGVSAVFSTEPRIWPKELTYDRGQGFRCVCPNRSAEHGCDQRALIDGTAVFVTGTFGLVCASHVVNALTVT